MLLIRLKFKNSYSIRQPSVILMWYICEVIFVLSPKILLHHCYCITLAKFEKKIFHLLLCVWIIHIGTCSLYLI